MRVFNGRTAIGLAWITLISGGFLFAAPRAGAHHRDFTLSRDFFLPYKGEKEIESRSHFFNKTKQYVQEFEFEYGITDHIAFEPGIMYVRDNGEELKYEGFDGELRLNFGDFHYDRILPALNFEFEKPKNEDSHGELKFISTVYFHDGGDLTINVNVGQNLEGDNKSTDSELTLGYVRPLNGKFEGHEEHGYGELEYMPGLRGGFEFVRDLHDSGHDMLLGPTLVYRASKNFNVLGTYAFAINNREDNSDQFHFIMEYEF